MILLNASFHTHTYLSIGECVCVVQDNLALIDSNSVLQVHIYSKQCEQDNITEIANDPMASQRG